ncbi:translational GTPase TypA [Candidatus Pantoea edessiphila]|uniref:Large ribosomal subunit assembly factor BipA n=1 Tax=Candidatus Pantoea edessiphila TaxID=2044610 RepID=A0A2P5SXJ3_9GAMM|nr:translational GTPase TypA [Candidatus Pantoea edessiphila]MBK4775716.1 translational GTPase TypA [Pantoea sp. Edef]PPI87056.1 translational GTPase TypA [Candidatus Pantoea edessiphila]
MINNIRNIAIIAHVDHGKTTLVDKLLQQSGIFNINHEIIDRVMDCNELEKERGITILSKNTAIKWNNYHINIIDTPGHADFGGEVERILSMVDAVLLVVDAIDGPMPQTSFVTKKSLDYNLKFILVINKIDRYEARPDWVVNKVFDMFFNLNANDEQLEFPIIYTSALNGIAGSHYNNMGKDMTPLYKEIIKNTPPPQGDVNAPLQMQISQLHRDNYLGLMGIGRLKNGVIKQNQHVIVTNRNGKILSGKINKIFGYLGLEHININLAEAGNIVAITGLNELNISDTICDPKNVRAMPSLKVDEPTIRMFFNVNTSPFCGKEGKYLTSRKIFDRLKKEAIHNISLRVEETKDSDVFCVCGRGDLHISILIENMRREGFEFAVSRPKVIFREIDGRKQEPFEEVILDIEELHQGLIMRAMGERRGNLKTMEIDRKGRIRLYYIMPSRGLIGFRNQFMQLTSGSGNFYSTFIHYDDAYTCNIRQRQNGVLISNSQGKTVAFALYGLQERGNLLINQGTEVYEGQIIGIHNRSNDLTVNVLASKKLTNMRASGSDETINLTPPLKMTLEQAIDFINDDELVEVTPKSIRIRKRYLKEHERRRALRNNIY